MTVLCVRAMQKRFLLADFFYTLGGTAPFSKGLWRAGSRFPTSGSGAPPYSRPFPFFCWQGKLDKALELFMKSLAIRQQVYGDDHPKVATAMNNIAQLYKQQVL